MKALTIRQPWVHAIFHEGKNVENRTWRPPESLMGRTIVIHAAVTLDRDATFDVNGDELVFGAIVGVARIVAVKDSMRNRWFSGPFGWVLEDVRELPQPIPRKGRLGLWNVDAAALRSIRRVFPDLTNDG